jgi:hypothetical protein
MWTTFLVIPFTRLHSSEIGTFTIYNVGTSHSPNAQSLLLWSTWEHPTVQHAILTPSVEQTTFTPNSMQRRHGIYTLRLTVTAADVRARARV